MHRAVKIGATTCQILRLTCTKFDFSWGSAPDPAGGAYSAPLNLLTVFKGTTSKGTEGEGGGEGKGEGKQWERGVEKRGREGRKGREGKGFISRILLFKPWPLLELARL